MATKTQADKVPAPDKKPIPRGERGYFAKGNQGKQKGTVSWANRKLADAARELFEKDCPDEIIKLLKQNKNLPVKLRTIEFLAERAFGRAPLTVLASLDPNSPEGILLQIAGQVIPGSNPSESGT